MPLSDLAQRISDSGKITAEDVLALRREVFADGVTDATEADIVFTLEDACREKDESWSQFYVDALTDYFVWHAVPRGYVSETQARELIHRIARNNRIESTTELELVVNIIHWAEACPAELAEFVLFAVRESVLDPDEAAYGQGRRPKLVDAVDVELIKRAIYAPATDGGISVTRLEAEVIFDLNDATTDAENDPEWTALFVHAIANHLMYPRAPYVPPPAEDVSRREKWLKERRGTMKLLRDAGKSLGKLDVDFDAFREAMKGPIRHRDMAAEAQEARVAAEREAIDAKEAQWLISRIKRDGSLNENEKALLAFIRKNAPGIDPSLEPLLAEAGV